MLRNFSDRQLGKHLSKTVGLHLQFKRISKTNGFLRQCGVDDNIEQRLAILLQFEGKFHQIG